MRLDSWLPLLTPVSKLSSEHNIPLSSQRVRRNARSVQIITLLDGKIKLSNPLQNDTDIPRRRRHQSRAASPAHPVTRRQSRAPCPAPPVTRTLSRAASHAPPVTRRQSRAPCHAKPVTRTLSRAASHAHPVTRRLSRAKYNNIYKQHIQNLKRRKLRWRVCAAARLDIMHHIRLVYYYFIKYN